MLRSLISLILICLLAQPSQAQFTPPTTVPSHTRPAVPDRKADARSEPTAWRLSGFAWADDTDGRRWVFIQHTNPDNAFKNVIVYIDGIPAIQHQKRSEHNCEMFIPYSDGVLVWFRRVEGSTSCAAYDRITALLEYPSHPLEQIPGNEPSIYLNGPQYRTRYAP